MVDPGRRRLGGLHAQGLATQNGKGSFSSDGREVPQNEKAGYAGELAIVPDYVLPAFCVSALPTDCELVPFCLCLLSFCPTLLPAVPGGFPWSGPAAL